ncbi:hypothetical protein N306_06004, partial [Opisthocomus hoazin]
KPKIRKKPPRKPKSNHVFQVSKVCRAHGLELMPCKAPQPRFLHLKCKTG